MRGTGFFGESETPEFARTQSVLALHFSGAARSTTSDVADAINPAPAVEAAAVLQPADGASLS